MRNHHEARSVHIRPFRKELPTFLLASPPPRSPSSPLVEEEEGEGEDEGRQACTAALALNPMLTVSIASKRGWCCPPPTYHLSPFGHDMRFHRVEERLVLPTTIPRTMSAMP